MRWGALAPLTKLLPFGGSGTKCGTSSATNEITNGATAPCFAEKKESFFCFAPHFSKVWLFAPSREWIRVAASDRLSLKQKAAFFRKLGLIHSQSTSIDSHSMIYKRAECAVYENKVIRSSNEPPIL